MIVLLGETAAALAISERLIKRGLELIRIQNWTEKSFSQVPALIIDASHPSSNMRFAPLRNWCEQRGIPYLGLERPETKIPESPLIHPVFNWDDALFRLEQRVNALFQDKKRAVTIFVTTGSQQLESIVNSTFACNARLVVRILPEGRLVQKCQDMGVQPRDIVAMQGPFSKEINRVLFKFYGADILLTKDSGLAGGTDTKVSAAIELGLEIVIIKKAKTSTPLTMNSINELLDWVDKNIPKSRTFCEDFNYCSTTRRAP